MRLTFLVLVVVAPLGACSDTFVTAPPPVTAAPTIVIRGAIVVDGVLVGRSDINPTDIQQVEVIKGAAAATVYGAETNCPPIIVHTRRASSAPRADRWGPLSEPVR